MNVRAFLSVLGLLTLLTAGCGGDSDGDVLALSALPDAVTLAADGSVEVSLTLTRRGPSGTATFIASGLPTGLTATFEPAELTGSVHRSTLTLQASLEAVPGAYVIEVQAAEGGHSDTIEIPVEVVTASVSGTIHFQNGLPITTAIVEVPGRPAVLVDEEGRYEIPEVNLPYDLRVSWPEAGSVHIYRGLEDRNLELKPFVDFHRRDQLLADFDVTITNWVPGSDFRAWTFAQDERALIEWHAIPGADGRFWGTHIYHEEGPAVLQGLSFGRDAARVVTEYRGFLEVPLMLDADGSAKGLSAELTPIGSFDIHPSVSAAPGLTPGESCPTVEQPHIVVRLFCNGPQDGLPPLPELPSGELALVMDYVSAEGGLSRQVLRGLTPTNTTPELAFAAPPVLEAPAADATLGTTQTFLVADDGEAPITLSLHRRASNQQVHITTREREIALPDLGQFVLRPDIADWEWTVRAMPDASGWEVLEDGGVLGIQHRSDDAFDHAALGEQPHTTRSEIRAVRISWW